MRIDTLILGRGAKSARGSRALPWKACTFLWSCRFSTFSILFNNPFFVVFDGCKADGYYSNMYNRRIGSISTTIVERLLKYMDLYFSIWSSIRIDFFSHNTMKVFSPSHYWRYLYEQRSFFSLLSHFSCEFTIIRKTFPFHFDFDYIFNYPATN